MEEGEYHQEEDKRRQNGEEEEEFQPTHNSGAHHIVGELDEDIPPVRHRVFDGEEYDAGEGISVGQLLFLT